MLHVRGVRASEVCWLFDVQGLILLRDAHTQTDQTTVCRAKMVQSIKVIKFQISSYEISVVHAHFFLHGSLHVKQCLGVVFCLVKTSQPGMPLAS
jgi:hypothetical protein